MTPSTLTPPQAADLHPLAAVPVDRLLGMIVDLDDATAGRNGFGGDTAEVYAYRLTDRDPARGQFPDGAVAAQRLLHLLSWYAAAHEDVTLEVDGRPFGRWVGDEPNGHRWHVRVVHAPVDPFDDLVTQAPYVAHLLEAARAERDRLRSMVGRLHAWTHEAGRSLCPPRAGTYGEGMRDAKGQIASILGVQEYEDV